MIFSYGDTTDNYRRIDLSNTAHLIIFNDSVANVLSISLDGLTEIGFFYNGGVEFRDINIQSVFVKSRTPGASCSFRVWGYGDKRIIYPPEQARESIKTVDVPKNFKDFTFDGGKL